MDKKQIIIGVIGGHSCNTEVEQISYNLGKNIVKVGAKLVCGGLSGVMEAVAKGAQEAGGTTIGIIPGGDKKEANPYIDIVIPSGIGLARNTLVVRTADVIIALPGGYGTLSEIAFALNLGKKVVNLSNWDIPGSIKAKDADEAIKIAVQIEDD